MAKIKVGVAEVGKKPRIVEIEDTLASYQAIVKGNIQPFEVLWGSSPTLYVNEEGIFRNDCPANRAVFATKEMVEQGYLSQLDMSRVVKEGELYSILFGDILAVAYDVDEDWEMTVRDISAEEFSEFYKTFEDPDSGIMAAMALQFGRAA